MVHEQYTYARFWKCALQVNLSTYSGKYRGDEHGSSPEDYAKQLRQECEAQNIDVVGLADHGNVDETDVIRKELESGGIIVFPGFEVATTEKVHWVCLFPEGTPVDQLNRFLGKLHLTDPADGVRPSDLSGEQLLNVVKGLNGFCYGAHATSGSGLLKQKCNHLWKLDNLRAAQIPGSVDHLPNEYKPIALNKNPDYRRSRPMGFINAKDVAKPEDLRDPRASTLIKMTRPCFESFLMAFKDPDSRVRLHDQVSEKYYSRIKRVEVEGGYFDGLDAEMSDHLNTVIGGRGTGKSTLLECIRYTLEVPHKGEEAKRQGDLIVKENLGKAGGRVTLHVESAANNMKCYEVVRRYGEPPSVKDENGDVSTLHPHRDLLPQVEMYGQNEIFELARSPGALAGVLNRFLPEAVTQQAQLDSVSKKLKDNAKRLLEAYELKDELELELGQLPKLQEQVKQFKEQGLEEKLKQVPLLERERRIDPRMMEELERLRSGKVQLEETLPDLVFLSDTAIESLPHSEMLKSGRKILDELDSKVKRNLKEIDTALDEAASSLKKISEELKLAQKESEEKLEKEFAKLPMISGKDGKEIGHTYQRLLRRIEEVKPAQARLKTVNDLVENLEQDRRNFISELSDIRSSRTAAKQREAKRLNKRLDGKLRITIVADGLREPLREFLHTLQGIGPKRTEWVKEAEAFTVLGLVSSIREGKESLLAKDWGLTSSVADALTNLTKAQILDLESIDLEDRVILELNVAHAGESFRPLENLSTGQQCTAILHLLLLENQDPLIMDQPEDNLDNSFIAERIVEELRSAKTERQFLFATHNANIPVFGDAEWIGVCSATEDRAEMPEENQGSIDVAEIRNHVANILEGGREAFMQRKDKYGFDY